MKITFRLHLRVARSESGQSISKLTGLNGIISLFGEATLSNRLLTMHMYVHANRNQLWVIGNEKLSAH